MAVSTTVSIVLGYSDKYNFIEAQEQEEEEEDEEKFLWKQISFVSIKNIYESFDVFRFKMTNNDQVDKLLNKIASLHVQNEKDRNYDLLKEHLLKGKIKV